MSDSKAATNAKWTSTGGYRSAYDRIFGDKTMDIEWTNPDAVLSGCFLVRDALWIPSYRVMHIPSEQEKANILAHADRMDKVGELVGLPVVHCWIRPTSINAPGTAAHGKNYNALVGGATHSQHIYGSATDFHVVGMTCDAVRNAVRPHLIEWELTMEENPGSGWVHLDSRPVTPTGPHSFTV